ncbi:MAG: helix-turn-helix domain-containing protein [Halobacteriales archaeon]
MKYLDLKVDLPSELRHPMEEFLRTADAIDREELLAWNLTPETVEYALFYVEGDIGAYRSRIADVDSIRSFNLTPIDAGSFYSYVCQETRAEEQRWRAAFARRNLVVVPPIVYDGTGMSLTIVGEGKDLTALLEALPDPIDTEIDGIGDYNRRHGTIAGSLTDRQLEAVTTAVELGYFDVPREASLGDVADLLGCADSTASNHLRKATADVMTRLVDRYAPLEYSPNR